MDFFEVFSKIKDIYKLCLITKMIYYIRISWMKKKLIVFKAKMILNKRNKKQFTT